MSVDGGRARIVLSWLPCPYANPEECAEEEPVAALVAEPARDRPRERLPDARRDAAGEGGAMRVGVNGELLEGSVGVCTDEVDGGVGVWEAGEMVAGGSSEGFRASGAEGAP